MFGTLLTWLLRRKVMKLHRKLADVQQAYDKYLYTSLGMLTVSWTQLESVLDFVNLAIVAELKGERHPVSLKAKVRLIRKAHTKVARLSPLREEALSLMGDIVTLSERRHDLIHGRVVSDQPGGLKEFERLLHENGGVQIRRVTYEPSQIYDLCLDVYPLTQRTIDLSRRMLLLLKQQGN